MGKTNTDNKGRGENYIDFACGCYYTDNFHFISNRGCPLHRPKSLGEPVMFSMYRKSDESGVSGTGRVVDGIRFANGKVVISWRTKYTSVAVYDSFEDFKALHIDSHPTNETEIKWHDNLTKQKQNEESI